MNLEYEKRGRKNKFNEPSRTVTVRVPESKYDLLKKKIIALVEKYRKH